MNVAIIGFGKLGKKIEELIINDSDFNVILKINSKNLDEFTEERFKKVDVAIELSGPHHAYENLLKLSEWKINTICGSTGWTEKLSEIKNSFTQSETAFLYASNFSLGMNIFFELNKRLAHLMSGKSFDAEVKEVHHIHKLDSPSGTSLTIAQDLIANHDSYSDWKLKDQDLDSTSTLPIDAKREGEVKGDHTVVYQSKFEKLSLHHSAFDRAVFAEGAITAAKWIYNKNGIYSMKDVIGI